MKTNLLLAILFLFPIVALGQADDDPVIEFYLSQLDSAFQEEYIFVSDKDFSVEIQSVMIKSDYRGEIDQIDTATYKLFYSGQIDSSTIIDSALKIEENRLPEKFFFNPPWYENNSFFFFPNDTGGTLMPIGFKPDSLAEDTVVTGFLNMDRYDSKLKSIFLFDPAPVLDEYDHLSRIFYFGTRDQFQVLLKYEIQGTKLSMLGRQYFKQILQFSNYQIND